MSKVKSAISIFMSIFFLYGLVINNLDTNAYGATEEKPLIVKNFELKEKAKNFGIDTNGLTDKQLEKVIVTKENEEILEKAKKFGIDTNGLTFEQLKENVIAKENEEIIAKAKKAGISTEGLTPEQVVKKVSEEINAVTPILSEQAAKAEEKNDALKVEKKNSMGQSSLKEKTKEKEAIIAKAKKAGISTDGLTSEQVIAQINEQDKELSIKKGEENKEFIQEMAKMYGIVTTGMSFEQIEFKVKDKMMPILIEKAKELGIDYVGLSYEQLLQKVKAKEIEDITNSEKK